MSTFRNSDLFKTPSLPFIKGEMSILSRSMEQNNIYHLVQDRYGQLASESKGTHENVARAFGYEASELNSIPKDANLGVSCGNPLVLASLHEGENIIDLGSGGGIDALLAAKRVGPTGRVIGVDMTKSMLELARKNAQKAEAFNLSFVEASITSIPLPDAMADCIISNCVVNLVPRSDKAKVFNEAFRLLKPGGRIAISDILLRKQPPESITRNMSLYVGCIAGASYIHEYEDYLRSEGFRDILIVDKKGDLNVYKQVFSFDDKKTLGCQSKCTQQDDTQLVDELSEETDKIDFNEWAGSFDIYALKP
ncbi:hypothetical protein PENSTE_c005G01819 [Penicillium steckii]|uniref:Arsenite methyltransferase n=1 Tax=Penicillium steckii TaxID=303698 RepID=A0A1V6TK93_9EURO|nr:hypothetical protein PENSTE_c005G01819 [Penicillium steckii]